MREKSEIPIPIAIGRKFEESESLVSFEFRHSKVSFDDEYRQLLKQFEIEYDDQFIFKQLE
jgi:hypothetical protein